MSMNSTAAAEIKAAAKAKSGFKAWKAVVFLICFVAFFALFAVPMGLSNMMDTMMNTAYRLLMDTTLYLMAIAVIVGALSAVLTEFGVVELINHVLSPLRTTPSTAAILRHIRYPRLQTWAPASAWA